MRKNFLQKMAMVALAGAACGWLYVRKTTAAPQIAVFGQAACTSYVPPSWGEFKGTFQQNGVVFQDNAGTLRVVTNIPCETTPQIALEIRRSNSK